MNMPMDAAAVRRALLDRMLAGEVTPVREAEPDPIRPRDPAQPVPLTPEQRQLWLHAAMAPDMPLYNESITIHRLGRYDHRALEQALSEIVRRHAIWRTAFIEQDGDLFQEIAAPFELKLPLIDISHLPAAERDAEAVRLATEDARAPIPLDQAPLFRARVVKLDEEEHRLYLTLHHIIFDGVSIYRTLVPELSALVAAYEQGEPSPLPEPALQYADYAAWQARAAAGPEIERQVAYWHQALSGDLPRLELAGDRPRPALPTHAGSMEVFELDAPLIERLKDIAREGGATLYMVLLAAYKTMLFRTTGNEDIIIGGVTDTRRRPELQPLIGYFLNTMALRSRPRGALRFRDYLAQVKTSVIGALGATDVPFDRLVRQLGIKRGTGTHPLFNTLFSIEPPVAPFPPGWDLTQMDVTVGAAKYDLYLELDERPEGGMAGRFLYSTELFDPATIHRMIGHWTRMLHGIAADPDQRLADLPMIGAEERGWLTAWNATARDWPHASVVDAVAQTVSRRAEHTAILFGEERWTYADLARRSDAIAARLADEGVAPGALVGLAVARGPWMLAAMLGVLKCGAAYLPLDTGFPPARLKLIVESAAPALILAETRTAGAIPPGVAPLLLLSPDWPEASAPRVAIAPDSLAYVRYTSGSTGVPKGVEIPHGALINLLCAMRATPGFAPDGRLLALTTLSFDISELELWLPLVAGGIVVIAPRETAMDMAALAQMIEAVQPSQLQATPATWRGLIEAGWQGAPGLKALVGGEALPRALADQLLPRVGELWNMYGPTETTVWSTCAQVGAGPIDIGRPIANTVVRIIDREGQERPVGAVGEIAIGGAGLARGYRGRPDLTEARFVVLRGERLYRTGDLGRWRADGTLECWGRVDHEEKIRGFRVAIEEVEGALLKLPGVSAAAVTAWPDPSGERALVGYMVGPGDPASWREQLGETLPDYMIPSRFVALDELPLTPNGKVDRKALPAPDSVGAPVGEPPRGPAEERLAAIWRDVLKVQNVARDDDFFALGGHSLLVARLLRRVEAEYRIKLPMAALFRAPKLADMAELIESGHPVESPALIPIQPNGSRPPLIWLDGGSTFLPLADRLGGDQPFLGLSIDVVMESIGGCPARLEELAAHTVQALKAIQPEGPYRIGGWCTSGILAYAVADHLLRHGQEVKLLALVHAFHPVKARALGSARVFASKLRFHLDCSMKQPEGERWRYFVQRLRGLSDAAALAGGREAVLQPKLRTALDKAALRYTPPPYGGRVALFQPAEHPTVLDFVEEWADSVWGRFEAFTIAGGHRTMLEPPHVDELAVKLRPILEEVEAVPLRKAS